MTSEEYLLLSHRLPNHLWRHTSATAAWNQQACQRPLKHAFTLLHGLMMFRQSQAVRLHRKQMAWVMAQQHQTCAQMRMLPGKHGQVGTNPGRSTSRHNPTCSCACREAAWLSEDIETASNTNLDSLVDLRSSAEEPHTVSAILLDQDESWNTDAGHASMGKAPCFTKPYHGCKVLSVGLGLPVLILAYTVASLCNTSCC